jgi:predicted AAA+ superfamily ATPase
MLPRDLEPLRVDPEGYLRALAPPILVDEWQLAGTDLLWTVKRIVDDDSSPGRFLLTGSVEPASYGPTYPLTGRAARVVMRPMTHAELAGRGDRTTFLTDLLAGAPPGIGSGVTTDVDLDLLTRSGFPAARDMPDARLFLDAYASLVSQRAGAEGRDATRLLRAMRVLATLTGQAAPDQRIWSAADINKATWKHYEDLLLRVHLLADTPAFESNRLKRLTAYPKRFLADTAMALALADRDIDDLRADPTGAGRFLESFVMQQLRPQVDAVHGTLMHVRTGSGEREVDAIIEAGRTHVGIEVKLGRRPGRTDAQALEWARDHLGDSFTHGFVVHTGADCYALGDRVTAVPLGVICGA